MKPRLALFVILIIAIWTGECDPENGFFNHDPDIDRNVTELIQTKGYPIEEHVVQTEDGYLLSVQRIPHGRNGTTHFEGKKTVVLLQHGLLSSSSDFVINFPDQSLGFILADKGYDVWMGNSRGNTYSRRHVKYNTDTKEFWRFCFDKMGSCDIPATIDYILNKTKQEQLFYIGHSQGSTALFALLSESPEYNKKIKLFIALAPVTTVSFIASPIKQLASYSGGIEYVARELGYNELLPSNKLMKLLGKNVCDTSLRWFCKKFVYSFFGKDAQQLNTTRLGVYVAHTPAGTSLQSVMHFAQMYKSEKFEKYDYGRKENLALYGQAMPPEYDVSKITTPVALMWSSNDRLGDPKDVALLQHKLKSVVYSFKVPLESFNHIDFVFAVNANRLVYDEVQHLLKKFAH